jgi:molecular chaperone DnaJ
MNFYVLLGVAQDASAADIKRAYRRLARRYHPGINPGDRSAEEMFQRVSEAYETLIDPGRRQQYDNAGAGRRAAQDTPSFMFAEFDFSVARHGAQASTFSELFAEVLHPVPGTPKGRPESGSDLHAALSLPFEDAVRGVERQVFVTRQVPCGPCNGAGQVPTAEGVCQSCRGAGHVRWARGHMVFSKTCAACGGAGRETSRRCPVCGGQGRVVRSEALPVFVPSGVVDGSRLRLSGLGHAGAHGGRAGDLYVTIHVHPHEIFRRHGDDLVCELPVSVHEAVLGARVDVPTLDGFAKLRIPPGTQAGQRLRLAEQGLPTATGSRGDLLFDVRLVLPEQLDDRSKELMREFGQRNGGDVRRWPNEAAKRTT